MNKISTNRGFGYKSSLIFLAFLIPFLYLAFFTYPYGDDFQRAIKANFFLDIYEGFHELFRAYWKWSGRYTHHFSVVFFGKAATSRIAYTSFTLAYFALFWFGAYGIFREIGSKEIKGQSFCYATLALLVMFSSQGNILFFQYNITNQLGVGIGLTACLYYIWSLCRVWNLETLQRRDRIFAIASCILAIGFYEYSAFMVVIISITSLYIAHVYKHRHFSFYKKLFYISIVFFLISYLARGNFRRPLKAFASLISWDQRILQLKELPFVFKDTILPAIFAPFSYATLFMSCFFVPKWETPLAKKVSSALILFLTFLALFGFVFSQSLVHALSNVPIKEGSHIVNLIAGYTIPAFVFMVLIFKSKDQNKFLSNTLIRGVALIACIGILFTSPNFQSIYAQITVGQFQLYKYEQDSRHEFLKTHQDESIVLSKRIHAPFPFPGEGLEAEYKAWPNKYAKHFYGVKDIVAVNPDFTQTVSSFNFYKAHWYDFQDIQFCVGRRIASGSNDSFKQSWIFIMSPEEMRSIELAIIPEDSIFFKYILMQEGLGGIKGRLDEEMQKLWPLPFVFHEYSLWEADPALVYKENIESGAEGIENIYGASILLDGELEYKAPLRIIVKYKDDFMMVPMDQEESFLLR